LQAIPDTGPGLSGFLAHHLWRVFVYFLVWEFSRDTVTKVTSISA